MRGNEVLQGAISSTFEIKSFSSRKKEISISHRFDIYDFTAGIFSFFFLSVHFQSHCVIVVNSQSRVIKRPTIASIDLLGLRRVAG